MENVEIADVFEQMADLLEIQEANPFRVRAYRTAARSVDEHAVPLRRMISEGADPTQLAGIGKEMASHIRELLATGKLGELEKLAAKVPRSLIDLMRLPGVGPKKARRLWQELGIDSVDAMEEAACAGRIRALAGFGERSEAKILAAIERYRQLRARWKLAEADQHVRPLLDYLREVQGLEHLEVAGSYRRRRETVGDIDLLAVAAKPAVVMDRFAAYPRAASVERAGETRATIVLRSGLQVDLRVVPAKSYGAAMVYFTGSKAHNIKLRRRSLERGLRISEYGVFRSGEESAAAEEPEADAVARDPWAGEWIAGRKEVDVYAAVELPWIPPELREDRGEIAAAARGRLPRLIELGDLKGDLQMHSTWSDGRNTIEEMLAACAGRGYEYCALTDHSKSLAMTGGLDAKRLREQWREIAEVAARHPGIRLLRAQEVDILADGSLDQDDETLGELDLVVVAVHSFLDLPAKQQTERIVKALQHPAVDILAHPTGRKINRRAAFELDIEEVLRCAKENRVAVELNAHPDRLDLKDTHLMLARELGVKVVISTDAHRIQELAFMQYGVEQARRAWLSRKDVLNALSLKGFLAWLAGR